MVAIDLGTLEISGYCQLFGYILQNIFLWVQQGEKKLIQVWNN